MKSSGFSLFRNLVHSLRGVAEVSRHERPMQAEWLLFFVMAPVPFFLEVPFLHKAALFLSLLIPMAAELTNSAIERTVDLVTDDYHERARRAKDAASAIVLFALVFTGLLWAAILAHNFLL